MGVGFLSVVKGAQAIASHRYKRLGVIAGVDLLLIFVSIYLVETLSLFTPSSAGYPSLPVFPIQDTSQYSSQYTSDFLGLLAGWAIAGGLVTIDAVGCQKSIAQAILDQHAD